MFGQRETAEEQSRRDKEWRHLVRAVTAPEGAVSERDEGRFLSYLGELGCTSPRSFHDDVRRGHRERDGAPRDS